MTQPPTPVLLPGESSVQRSLAGYSPQGCKELDVTEATQHARMHTGRIRLRVLGQNSLPGIVHHFHSDTYSPRVLIFCRTRILTGHCHLFTLQKWELSQDYTQYPASLQGNPMKGWVLCTPSRQRCCEVAKSCFLSLYLDSFQPSGGSPTLN